MPRPLPTFALCLLTFTLPLPSRAQKPKDLFHPTDLHTIHLHLSEQAFNDIQPRRAGPFSGMFAATRPADAEREHTSPFGYTYTYVHADIDIDKSSLKDIGARYKGNSSFMTGKGLKKPFKLDFNHFADQEFSGLHALNLHNNAIDPTLLRESFSYYVFRECGVPASRTSGALLFLSVDNQYQKRLVGFYSMVEEVDKRFLKDRFGTSKGLLLKPENAMNLPFLGDTWDRYEKIYRPHTEGDPKLQQRLIDFLRLIHKADDAAFDKQIESFIDTDNLFRFLAAHALLSNMDSILTTGHNFFLYIHPKTNKILFIPWDLNLSMGGFDWVGGINDQIDLSVRQPWIKPNALFDRLLANPRFQSAYRAMVEKLTKEVFTPDKLNPVIDAHYKMLATAEKQAELPPTTRPTFPNNPAFDFKAFVAQRQANVFKQLTTGNPGYEPYWQRGPFGRRARPATNPTTRPANPSPAASAIEQAHIQLWTRFIDRHGVILDFTALDGSIDLPTPEECKAGKPNALGWYQPIENGAMFNGLYMDGIVARWRQSREDSDAAKARRLMNGLLFLNSVSDVKGFVARGVSTDDKSHFPMGSNDQTLPWFFGLYRYLDSGLAGPAERQGITTQLTETANAILELNWRMPAEPPYNTRGSFAGHHFDALTRRLFVMKLMHHITNDAKWDKLYRATLQERGGDDNASTLDICAAGMKFTYAKTHNWTACCDVAALRALWELEKDESIRSIYYKGLQASANLAAESLPRYEKFNAKDQAAFNPEWRTPMMPLWKPQPTEKDAEALAKEQLTAFTKISPRRNLEANYIREPASAAWIVTLCPDPTIIKQHAPTIEKLITHFNYAKLHYSTFFWIEAAYWRLPSANRTRPD